MSCVFYFLLVMTEIFVDIIIYSSIYAVIELGIDPLMFSITIWVSLIADDDKRINFKLGKIGLIESVGCSCDCDRYPTNGLIWQCL